MAVLTLRLDEQTNRKLQKLSKESERPKSYFLRRRWSSTFRSTRTIRSPWLVAPIRTIKSSPLRK